MNTADRYHFGDFTRENYRRLLRIAREQYPFKTFTDFHPGERFLLWRHDVDFSIHAARKLARIEAEEGVHATYFLYPHSEFYNLFEAEISGCVHSIAALGHSIGLHFDTHYHGVADEAELERLIELERRFVEDMFRLSVDAVSFHIATPFTQECRRHRYAGLVNANAEYLQTEVGYCSDSNGYWRFDRLEDVLRRADRLRLQVLTHPEMWQDTVMSPKQRVQRCIDGRAEKTRDWYDRILQTDGRENVDWE